MNRGFVVCARAARLLARGLGGIDRRWGRCDRHGGDDGAWHAGDTGQAGDGSEGLAVDAAAGELDAVGLAVGAEGTRDTSTRGGRGRAVVAKDLVAGLAVVRGVVGDKAVGGASEVDA